MNLLYIHTHDTGRFIEPYDNGISTPSLMKLAKEGTVFRNMYCCGPTCSPSRSALLTGQYPHQNGMLGLAHRGFSLNDYGKHLCNFLKGHGYETVLCGMQHEAAKPDGIGYDRVYVDSRREAEDLTAWDESNEKAAISFLREKHDMPFFLSYGLAHTHRPFLEVDKSICPDYIKVPSVLPDTRETREDFAGFLTSAMRADCCIGRVLQVLEEEGLNEETVVIYTTDHGIAFPHMKCNLYDTGIGVAFIIKYPGNKSAGKVTDVLSSQIDIYPTICGLLDLPNPPWLEGSSLKQVLDGNNEEIHEAVFSEVTYHAAYEPQRCVRTKRYKYIRRYDNYDMHVPANMDNGLSKEFLIDQELLDKKRFIEELYDLYIDPSERNNLVKVEEYQEIREYMEKLLACHQSVTDDFMGIRPVPRPDSLILNKLSCIDPESKCPEDFE